MERAGAVHALFLTRPIVGIDQTTSAMMGLVVGLEEAMAFAMLHERCQ